MVDVHKGPYAARFGDFYTAGAMESDDRQVDAPDRRGSRAAGRSPGPKAFDSTTAASSGWRVRRSNNERQVADRGPARRDRRAVRERQDSSRATRSSSGRAPSAAANQARDELVRGELERVGQLPESAVAMGPSIGSARSIRPRAASRRARASSSATPADDHGGTWAASAYPRQYNFRLYSNFTLFARDPVHGDEIEQNDVRTIVGPRPALLASLRPRRHGLARHVRRAAAQRRRRQRPVARREARPPRRCFDKARTRATTPRSDPRRRRYARGERFTCFPTSTCCPASASSMSRGTSPTSIRRRNNRRWDGSAAKVPRAAQALRRGRGHAEARRVRERAAPAFTRTTRARSC